MRAESVYSCEICGAQKRDVNRWWIAFERDNAFVLQPWNDGVAKLPTAMHLCGEACSQRLLSTYQGRIG